MNAYNLITFIRIYGITPTPAFGIGDVVIMQPTPTSPIMQPKTRLQPESVIGPSQ